MRVERGSPAASYQGFARRPLASQRPARFLFASQAFGAPQMGRCSHSGMCGALTDVGSVTTFKTVGLAKGGRPERRVRRIET